jgi:hypothetical protein
MVVFEQGDGIHDDEAARCDRLSTLNVRTSFGGGWRSSNSSPAKKKIVGAGIPFGAPVADELDARLDEVCRTIYLAFTVGYTPGSGPTLLRADLAGEAVELSLSSYRTALELCTNDIERRHLREQLADVVAGGRDIEASTDVSAVTGQRDER